MLWELSAISLKQSQVEVYVFSDPPAKSSCVRDSSVSPRWGLCERTFSDVINMCVSFKKKAMKEITDKNVDIFTYERKLHVTKRM